MKLSLHAFQLPLEHEFTIARGSMTSQRSLVVQLEENGVQGFGETTENSYYGYTLETISRAALALQDQLESHQFSHPRELWQFLSPKLADNPFALSAIDIAAHDLYGKLKQRHTFELLGLTWENIPDSSYTIGIDTIDKMIAKLEAQSGWSIYKIKLGTAQDVETIRQLRRVTDAAFRVDANCGWTPEQTIANSHHLKSLGVQFIEQPLPPDAPADAHRKVYQESALPIIADESCQVESDVKKCEGLFHGINVKLCKCGGLTPAANMLQQARQLGLKTMVGCMIESSIGISAAAQLLPLLDYADLDGAVLLAQDAGEGVRVQQGRITLSKYFGNGAVLSSNSDQLVLRQDLSALSKNGHRR